MTLVVTCGEYFYTLILHLKTVYYGQITNILSVLHIWAHCNKPQSSKSAGKHAETTAVSTRTVESGDLQQCRW